MPLLFAALLIVVVHLATGVGAWLDVGLLADDREMIGRAILRARADQPLGSVFFECDAPRGLYRPFVELLFSLELPYFGIRAFGYHVVNSLLHCGTALLWFVMLRRWSGRYLPALAGALLFVCWPGHSEATHWIAARTNVMSVFVMSLALLLHELGAARARWSLLVVAAGLGAVAVGCKESAAFVLPLAAVIAWLRAPTLRAALLRTVPMAVAVLGWLAWRAHLLAAANAAGSYGWRLERVGAESCADWVTVLLAPLHCGLAHPLATFGGVALASLQLALLLLASAALRDRGCRRVAAVAAALVAMGYVAGIGLEKLFPSTLQGARYTYEPALGLAALCGLGIARLPARWASAALALTLVVFTLALAHNRRSWLQASAVYERMRHEVEQQARQTQRPVQVFDAPGVYDGAFAYLNGFTEFLFWRETAPPGTDLRGGVASTQQWRQTMRRLAAAAAQQQALDASEVRWSDGALLPLELDRRWPAQPLAGVTIHYARIARRGVVANTRVPVQVMLTSAAPVALRVGEAAIELAGSEDVQLVQLWLPVPRGTNDIEPELVVRSGGGEWRHALGRRDVLTR